MAVESHIREVADKHRKIQELIEAEMAHSGWDEMRVAALKKEKLRLKDELEGCEPTATEKISAGRGRRHRRARACSRRRNF